MGVRVPLGVLRGTTGGTLEKTFILLLLNDKTLTNVCEHAAAL